MTVLRVALLTAVIGILYASSGMALPPPLIHPGALDSTAEFESIAKAVRQGQQPWAADFAKLRSNPHDRPDYQAHPVAVVVRGAAPNHAPENYRFLYNDAATAYALALDWRISGDEKRAESAAEILNAWARTVSSIGGTGDKYLASGLYGYQLAIAAETLRDFKGWSPQDQSLLKRMLTNVFATMNHDFLVHHAGTKIDYCWANWDLANVASLIAIGVYADRQDMYREARDYYLHGGGEGSILHAAWKLYPDGLAQWQESGRDQGHTMLGLGLAGIINEIALHQGDDLFSADSNRLLAAARYVAKYNTGGDVPYAPYRNSNANQLTISAPGRGDARPIWALLYAHYIQHEHLYAPELEAALRKFGLEGGGGDYGPNSGGYDQLGYGTLTFLSPSSTDPYPVR